MSTPCAGAARHWFSFYRQPGLRSPACVRCGTPNPRPLTKDEWDTLLQHREVRGYPFMDQIEDAINAHRVNQLWNQGSDQWPPALRTFIDEEWTGPRRGDALAAAMAAWVKKESSYGH